MDFVALDFETANANFASICQVGLVAFTNGEVSSTFSSLVDPEDFFDGINISIHGIDETTVRGAPTFAAVYKQIVSMASKNVVACHSSFDRSVLQQTRIKYGLADFECHWLDTTRVVRRTWPQYARTGYGLKNLTRDFGIEFKHHDAAEDARATGLVLVRAIRESGVCLEDWLVRSIQPLNPESNDRITRDGNPDGILYGEVAVFTGALSMPRREAADIASAAGCEVDAGVTKNTTLLIVSDQDVSKLADGHAKSNKHLKAETLIAKGQNIRILRETDFRNLCAAR